MPYQGLFRAAMTHPVPSGCDRGHTLVRADLPATRLPAYLAKVAANEVVPGPGTRHVIANVRRLRAELRLSQVGLAERLKTVGRPIADSGVNRIEHGRRRVDSDDLLALALALEVSPLTLLLPPTAAEGDDISLTDEVAVPAAHAWSWARAQRPLEVPEDGAALAHLEFQHRALPTGVNPFPRNPYTVRRNTPSPTEEPTSDGS